MEKAVSYHFRVHSVRGKARDRVGIEAEDHEDDDRQIKKAENAGARDAESDPVYIPARKAQRDAERALGAVVLAVHLRHRLSHIQAAGALELVRQGHDARER